MVFSFFKKHSGKKSHPEPAVHVQEEEKPASQHSPQSEHQDTEAIKEESLSQKDSTLDFPDFTLSEVLPSFEVDGGRAPEDAEVEEAAILFSNGQDAAAQAVLEGAVKGHGIRAERPWRLLFDLYRLLGQREAFEALEIEYATAFERSTPNWSRGFIHKKAEVRKGVSVGGRSTFSGELLGKNDAAFAAIQRTFERNAKLHLDVSKITRCDYEGCARLWDVFAQAGMKKYPIELQGKESLSTLLASQLEIGRAEGKECWLLLIELCQLQGQQEAFEEAAVNYAVTFEESPPSWVPGKVAVPELEADPGEETEQDVEEESDAYVLQGEIKSARFADLSDYAEDHDYVTIDCAELVRMDFVSAGVLLNVLSTVRSSGKLIVFRHPNYLVAELLGIVGFKEIATFILAEQ